jgi:hypothetical protein
VSPILESIGSVKGFGWGALLASSSFESIQTVNPTGGAATVSFTSIPSTYKHLQIRGIMHDDYAIDRAPNTGFDMGVQFNGDDNGSNYARHHLYGNGNTAVGAGSASSLITLPGTNQVANVNFMSVMIIDIHDYSVTTKNKTLRAFNGADANASGTTNRVVALNSGLWMNTAAITQITLVAYGTGFVAPTQFALYGIKGA